MFLLYIFVTSVAAAYCLLAIWVACGRGHWFARACVLLAALALLVPIRAYEPLILFGMTSVLLIGGWGGARFWRSVRAPADADKPSRPVSRLSFRLLDVLLACAVAGAASWLISVLVAKDVTVDWWRAAGTAGLLALVASLAVCVVAYGRWWWSLPLLAAGVVAAAALDVLVLDCWWMWEEMLNLLTRSFPIPVSYALFGLSILYGMFALLALAMTALALGAARSWKRSSWSIAFRSAAIALSAAAAIFLAWVYWRMLDVPQWSPGSADRPNALPRVFELAASIQKETHDEAEAVYAELISLLDQPSYVVWQDVRPAAAQLDAAGYLAHPRRLARALKARRTALMAEGRFDEAADRCLAVLRLAPMLDREGAAWHRWETDAVRRMGSAWLAEFREKLSPEKARESAEVILRIEAHREPLEATMLRDKIWNNRFTWREMLMRAVLSDLQGIAWPEPMERGAEQIAAEMQCYSRLLALDLLIRAHRREHGQPPATLDEIALPRHPEMVIDPYSDEAFIYQPTEQGFLLYSVGENGVDDRGRFTTARKYMDPSTRKTHDLDVDTMLRP